MRLRRRIRNARVEPEEVEETEEEMGEEEDDLDMASTGKYKRQSPNVAFAEEKDVTVSSNLQNTDLRVFKDWFPPFGGNKENAITPPVPPPKDTIDGKGKLPPILDERTPDGSMFAQTVTLSSATHNSGPEGHRPFDHYNINEANSRILTMLGDSDGQLKHARDQIRDWGDSNRQVSLNLNRAPDAPLLQGRHGLWVRRTNTSSGMFLRKESRDHCPECVRSIPIPAARQTSARYRLCPHWREVTGEGYTEATQAFGGSQNCPFCGTIRGTQSTRHADACPFHMAMITSTIASEYEDGLGADADFVKLRADPKAFDDATTTDATTAPPTTPAPAVRDGSAPPEGLDLNAGIVATADDNNDSEHSDEDDSGPDDDDDWKAGDAPAYVPPPPKKTGKPGKPDGSGKDGPTPPPVTILIVNGVVPAKFLRPMDAEDKAANATHCAQVDNIIKLSKSKSTPVDLERTAKAHNIQGVRKITKMSPEDRQHITDTEAAIKAAKLPRPFWEPNTYINASPRDFSKDTDGSQRLPDNVLEHAATIRPTLGQPDPAPSKTNYAGPGRQLARGNETWFRSRFAGDKIAYADWIGGIATFADLQKAAPIDTTAATHPTEFYIKDTLEGINWYGDTGTMVLPGPAPPPPGTPKGKNRKPIINTDGKTHEDIGKLVGKYLHQIRPAAGTRSDGSKKTDQTFCLACKKQTNKLGESRRHQHYGKCWANWPGPGTGGDGSGPPDGRPADGATDKGTRSALPSKPDPPPATPNMTRKRKLWDSVHGYVTDSEDERDFLPTAKKDTSQPKEIDDIGTPKDPSKSFKLGDATDTKIFTENRKKRPTKKAKKNFKTPKFISSTPEPPPNAKSPVSTSKTKASKSKKTEPENEATDPKESEREASEQAESPSPKKRKRSSTAGFRLITASAPTLPQKNLISTHTSRAKSKPFVPASATKATTATKLLVSKTSTYKSKDGQDVVLEERKFSRRANGKTPRAFTEVIESIKEPGKDAAVVRLYRFEDGEETGLGTPSKKRKIGEEDGEESQEEEEGNGGKVAPEEQQNEEDESEAPPEEDDESSEENEGNDDDKEEEEEQEKTPRSVRTKPVNGKEPEPPKEGKTPAKPKSNKKVTIATPATDDTKPAKIYRKTPHVATVTKTPSRTGLRATEATTPSEPTAKKTVAQATKAPAKKAATKTSSKAATKPAGKAAEAKNTKAKAPAKAPAAKKGGVPKRASKK